MKVFHVSFIVLFLVLIIASTFVSSTQPEWFYFYRDELYVSLFSGLFVLVLIAAMKFRNQINFTVIDIIILTFYSYSLINLLIKNKQTLLGNEFLSFTMLTITYFILKQYYQSIQKDDKAVKCMMIMSVYGLISLPIILSIIEFSGLIPVPDNMFILASGLHNPGATANYIASLSPFLFAVFIAEQGTTKSLKLLSLLLLVLSLLLIILMKARSAWIACAASLIFVFFCTNSFKLQFKRFRKSGFSKSILILFIVLSIGISLVGLYRLKKDSADGRLFIWKNCLVLIKEKPLFGYGYNSFIREYNKQQIKYFKTHPNDVQDGMLATDGCYAFNDYIQIAVELGIVGLTIFLLALYFIFNTKKLNQNSSNDVLLIGSKSSIIAILICSFFSYPFEAVQNYFLLFFFFAYISSRNIPLVKFNCFGSNLIIGLLSMFIFLSEYHLVNKFMAYTRWKNAFMFTQNKQNTEASEIYKSVYPALKMEPLFLFNYGTILSNFNEYEKSVLILEAAEKIKTSYDVFLNLGHTYEGINDNIRAELKYKEAAYLIPHKFMPRYYLLKLYQKTNQTNKAITIAKEITNMRIKVYSPTLASIQNEAAEFLNKKQ